MSVLFVLFAFIFFGGVQTTFAADATSIQESFIDIIVLIVHAVVYLSWIIIGMMGDLLTNDAVMHPGVVSTLKLLWTIIRNFINMAAVFWLLYIAFKTLFNFGDDGAEEAKKGLPKLAAALVLVNFSWLFMVVIIDASTVATNYAFSLTDTVRGGIHFTGDCKEGSTDNCVQKVYSIQYNTPPKIKSFGGEEADSKKQPKANITNMFFKVPYDSKPGFLESKPDFKDIKGNNRIYEINDVQQGVAGFQCFDKAVTGDTKKETRLGCSAADYLEYKYETASIIITTYPLTGVEGMGANSIVPTIATNLLQLESNLQRSKYTNSMGTLALDVIFSVIMSLVMLIAFVALFIILVIRVAVLWLALMASPLLVLYFFEPLESAVQENFAKVVHIAFVPAYFGVIFSLVFVLIGQLGYQQTTLLGSVGSGDATKPVVLEYGIMQAGSPLFNLLLTILVIVLFWMAVFWALEKADITGTVIETMKNGVQTGAKWVAKRPLYMDIVPIARRADGSWIKGDLKSKMDNFQRLMNDSDHTNDDDNVNRYTLDNKDAIDAIKGFKKNNFADELVSANSSMKGVTKIDINNNEHMQALNAAMKNMKGFKGLSGDQHTNAAAMLVNKFNGVDSESMTRDEFAKQMQKIEKALGKSVDLKESISNNIKLNNKGTIKIDKAKDIVSALDSQSKTSNMTENQKRSVVKYLIETYKLNDATNVAEAIRSGKWPTDKRKDIDWDKAAKF